MWRFLTVIHDRRFIAAEFRRICVPCTCPGVARVHDEPQVGDEPLEKHPKADQDGIYVEREGFESFDRFQRVLVSIFVQHFFV